MKKLFAILGCMAIAAVSQAQYVTGPTPQVALTVSTAFLIPGSTTTNIPASLAPVVKGGARGVAFYLRVGATNSASTTNATITIKPIAGPTGEVVDNQSYTLSVPQNGTTGYDYLTNIVETTANVGNAPGFQITSIQNTNLASIWITNVTAYAR